MNDLLKCRAKEGNKFHNRPSMDINEGCFYTVCTKSSDGHLCKHCMQDASCQRADDNFFGIFHLGMNERYVPHFRISLYSAE